MTYKKFTACCLDCKTEITINNLLKHLESTVCQRKQSKLTTQSNNNREKVCEFCKTQYTQYRHPYYCSQNPNKRHLKANNQFTKAKEEGRTFEVSEETRNKISHNTTGRKHSEESIQKISRAMQAAVANNPESYRGTYNRGRVKELICSNGFRVLGSWEKKFVEFCLDNSINIEQSNKGFSYEWNGTRTYFPDFYLPESDIWIEVKGLQTERDDCKWKYFREVHNKVLIIIDKTNINKLQNIKKLLVPSV